MTIPGFNYPTFVHFKLQRQMCSLTENKYGRCPHIGEHHKS